MQFSDRYLQDSEGNSFDVAAAFERLNVIKLITFYCNILFADPF